MGRAETHGRLWFRHGVQRQGRYRLPAGLRGHGTSRGFTEEGEAGGQEPPRWYSVEQDWADPRLISSEEHQSPQIRNIDARYGTFWKLLLGHR